MASENKICSASFILGFQSWNLLSPILKTTVQDTFVKTTHTHIRRIVLRSQPFDWNLGCHGFCECVHIILKCWLSCFGLLSIQCRPFLQLKVHFYAKHFCIMPCRTTPCGTASIGPNFGCVVLFNMERHEFLLFALTCLKGNINVFMVYLHEQWKILWPMPRDITRQC
jgi:hypothetical protein